MFSLAEVNPAGTDVHEKLRGASPVAVAYKVTDEPAQIETFGRSFPFSSVMATEGFAKLLRAVVTISVFKEGTEDGRNIV